MSPQNIQISDYDYALPDARIAKFPVSPRDHSRLLVSRHGVITDDMFYNLPGHLSPGSLMVFNNTRVIQARLLFRKSTGALIEVFLLEPAIPADHEQMFQTTTSCCWWALIGHQKRWKQGALCREIQLGSRTIHLSAELVASPQMPHAPESPCVRLSWDASDLCFAQVLDAVGQLPIPPYLNRPTQSSDLTSYQTVYSKVKGSVAAPTAGLHFTSRVLEALDSRGLIRQELTLHVGAGTFKPVKSQFISGHQMHTEVVSVKRSVIQQLISHDAQAIAVGTTAVRTLESLYFMGCHVLHPEIFGHDEDTLFHVTQWEPYAEQHDWPAPCEALQALHAYMVDNDMPTLHGSTQIIIVPSYKYRIVKALVTNFHQPQSTLLLLVSAFIGEQWRNVYRHALDNDYRFLSYGDSSLLIP